MITIEKEKPKVKRKRSLVIKRNWDLRMKRAKETVLPGYGLPFRMRKKPTVHPQRCCICEKFIEKNEKQIVIDTQRFWLVGNVGGSIGSVNMARSGGFNTPPNTFFKPKSLYAHPQCFACVYNKLMRNWLPDLEIRSLCEQCKDRFKCYTRDNFK